MSHTRGNYTVVYPVMRGTAPILQSLRRICFCGDAFNAKQWTGVAILLGGIFSLAAYNMMYIKNARDKLSMAAVVCRCNGRVRHPLHGLLAYDAWGIRQATNSFFYRLVLCHRWYCSSTFYFFRWLCTDNHPAVGPLILRGVVGGIIAIFSFGSIMTATRLDKVGEAAILRETSTNFAALIGWYFLKEPVGPYRSLMMFMVAFGAVFVEFGD